MALVAKVQLDRAARLLEQAASYRNQSIAMPFVVHPSEVLVLRVPLRPAVQTRGVRVTSQTEGTQRTCRGSELVPQPSRHRNLDKVVVRDGQSSECAPFEAVCPTTSLDGIGLTSSLSCEGTGPAPQSFRPP